jgi:hypothetical protein
MNALEGLWDINIFSPWGKIDCAGVFKTESGALKGVLRYGDPPQNYHILKGKAEGLNFSFEVEVEAFFTFATLEVSGKVDDGLKTMSGLARVMGVLVEFYGKKREN